MDEQITKVVTSEADKLVPQVYTDLAQPAVKEIGTVAGRTVKALLSPVRALLWAFEQIEQVVYDGVQKRLENIPEEKRKTPLPEVAVPLMQALTYTAQNDDLREMFLNLLASTMNIDQDKNVHPSFVEIIKQMNSLDAKVFNRLSINNWYVKALNPQILVVGQEKVIIGAMPEWFQMAWSHPWSGQWQNGTPPVFYEED